MTKFFRIRFFITLFALLPATFVSAEITPANVIVVAAEGNKESLAVARHYMEARGIPVRNLIELPLPPGEEISWDFFSSGIWNPLLAQLKKKSFLAGEYKTLKDAAGRLRIEASGTEIDAIVLCRGVPLRIAHNPEIAQKESAEKIKTEFAVNRASLDSELALLALPESPATALVQNPLFNKSTTTTGAKKIICVARLDGATREDCFALVDGAIFAERHGLCGRAYIDQRGPHPLGDEWLEKTGALLKKNGFETSTQKTPALIGDADRFDAPALYFGWYSQNIAGRLAAPEVRFAPGAIALHIHSFSAITLRSPATGWCAPLVAHGAAVTLGNVAEPYLQFTTVPPIFTAALLDGKQVGEAYVTATPAWSWQTILVGDPLYRPFKYPPEKQAQDAFRQKTPSQAYAILRAANLLKNEGKTDEAAQMLTRALANFKTLPVILAHAENAASAGKPIFWLSAPALENAKMQDIGLVLETARFLAKNKKTKDALAFYDVILSKPNLSPTLKNIVPAEAAKFAEESDDAALAEKWRALIPPPPPPPTAPAAAK